jgi:hypothetical protein
LVQVAGGQGYPVGSQILRGHLTEVAFRSEKSGKMPFGSFQQLSIFSSDKGQNADE